MTEDFGKRISALEKRLGLDMTDLNKVNQKAYDVTKKLEKRFIKLEKSAELRNAGS